MVINYTCKKIIVRHAFFLCDGLYAAGGTASLEVVAASMRAEGMFVARTMTLEGVKFSVGRCTLSGAQKHMYNDACKLLMVYSHLVSIYSQDVV